MVGNDIVDLKFARVNSRWKEQRFLDKLFTGKEQTFILKDNARYIRTWLLWSMKESAFKVASSHNSQLLFNPKEFHCKMESPSVNSVRFFNEVYQTISIIKRDFIYTTAFQNNNLISSKWAHVSSSRPKTQSAEMRVLCKEAYCKLKSVSETCVYIQKNGLGVPQIYVNDALQKDSISITHHGDFGGFAIAI